MKKTIHYTICGLEYVYIVNAPMRKTPKGKTYIDLPMDVIDKAIAKKIITDQVPIRGVEVIFLRKTLEMTLNQWAKAFGLTAAGILKWERAKMKRLARVNEAAVRALCAEILKISLKGKWSELVASNETPKKLSLEIKKAA
ncbi:hypothetical protein ACFLRA_03745 [Bdellovibrionota bacterium]